MIEVQHEVSLFTGYGGLTLGLRLAGVPLRTVLYCEINPYRQSIIRRRVKDGLLDDCPIWPDVRTLDGRPFAGKVGVLTASPPCQPHSTAGKRLGASDPRNLWPDTARLIGEIRPDLVFLENVPGITYPAGDREPYALTVLGDLARLGYDARWGIVGARDVGAPHRRDRWWCVAISRCDGRGSDNQREPATERDRVASTDYQLAHAAGVGGQDGTAQRAREGQPSGAIASVGNPNGTGREGEGYSEQAGFPFPFPPGPQDTDAWAGVLALNPRLAPALPEEEAESLVRGVADGPSARVGGRRKTHRSQQLQALGDGVVPGAAAMAFLRLEGKLAE